MGPGRRQFTDEFKREAVALLASSGRRLTQIAAELDIAPSMFRNWRGRSGGRNAGLALRPNTPAPAPHSVPDPAAEISRLRRENDRLRMERDVLKKLYPSSRNTRNEVPPDRRSAGRLPMRVMCAALSVSPSGYYAWRSRPQSPRKIANRALLGDIQRVHARHWGRYGAPRIHAELRAEGQTVGRKRIELVMRQHGIRARAPRRYRVCTTDSKHSLPVAPNLLDQNFVANRPNQVWLADITYIATGEGWLYLAVILDLFTRKVVG
jgi:transposase-like protein